MKLPEKKYIPKHSKTLRVYAIGWNVAIDFTSREGDEKDNKKLKEYLLREKKAKSKNAKLSNYFAGQYDCILEIEKLNGIGD